MKIHHLVPVAIASTVVACLPAAAAAAAEAQSDAVNLAPATDIEAAGTDDIVVTAQRRSESLQRVPIAVTAIPAAQIEQLNLRNLDRIQSITPGLTFEKAYGFAQNFIRGIGSSLPSAGLENATATYLDGAYLQRGSGAVLDLLDVASVQVLKGPQGTLYGRNATGGAILLTTADPTDEAGGHVSGEYGRFNHYLGEAVLNAPLTDTLSVRVAGRYVSDDGYIRNLFDGSKLAGRRSWVLRSKLAYRPSADFSAILAVERSDVKSGPNPFAQRLPDNLCGGCAFPGVDQITGFYDADQDYVEKLRVKATSVNLRMRGNSGNLTFESVTGFRDQDELNPSDQDLTRAFLFSFRSESGGKTFTQDFTMSTTSDSWINGLFGLSYLHDDAYYDLAVFGIGVNSIVPGQSPRVFNTVTTESVSGFGELILEPVRNLKITAGARYTYDRRAITGVLNAAGNIAFAGANGVFTYGSSGQFNSVTPRLVVAYDAGGVNMYVSYNKGFKAGGFTTPSFSLAAPIQPEKIASYEAGAKFVSADRRLRANLAVFRYGYDDVQVRITDLAKGTGTIQNAASAKGRGVELDMQYQAAPWLNVFAGAAYLKARYRSFPDAAIALPGAFGPDGGPTALVPGFENLSGFPLERAPKYTAFGGVNLEGPIGGSVRGELSVAGRYSSSFFQESGAGGPLRFSMQRKLFLATMSGAVGPLDERFKIGFYVENLTNQKYSLTRTTSAGFGGGEAVAPPRTYGLRVTHDF